MEEEFNNYYVDLPSIDGIGNPDCPMIAVDNFPTREEAIAFAREHFGADDEGRICLVSG
jgi:hypothetical protein